MHKLFKKLNSSFFKSFLELDTPELHEDPSKFFFCVSKKKKNTNSILVWNEKSVSKYCKNIHFGLNGPFKYFRLPYSGACVCSWKCLYLHKFVPP